MWEKMDYPETADDFLETYSFWDKEEIYTNGSRLIPQFRVEQMIGHYYLARINKLEQLCRDLYRIAAHEGYISNELHNRLVELGFAKGE